MAKINLHDHGGSKCHKLAIEKFIPVAKTHFIVLMAKYYSFFLKTIKGYVYIC